MTGDSRKREQQPGRDRYQKYQERVRMYLENPDCYGSSKNAAESGQEISKPISNLLGRIDQRRRTRNQIKREISTLSKSAKGGFSNTARNECVGECESRESSVYGARKETERGRSAESN